MTGECSPQGCHFFRTIQSTDVVAQTIPTACGGRAERVTTAGLALVAHHREINLKLRNPVTFGRLCLFFRRFYRPVPTGACVPKTAGRILISLLKRIVLKLGVKKMLVLFVLLMLAAGPLFALCTPSGNDSCCCKPSRSSGPSISTQRTPCCDVSTPKPVADSLSTERAARALDNLAPVLSLDTPAVVHFEPVFVSPDRSGPGDMRPISLYAKNAALLI